VVEKRVVEKTEGPGKTSLVPPLVGGERRCIVAKVWTGVFTLRDFKELLARRIAEDNAGSVNMQSDQAMELLNECLPRNLMLKRIFREEKEGESIMDSSAGELHHGNIVAIRASLKTVEFTRDNETKIRELDKIIRYAEQLKNLTKGER
jgi:hypothetical protein